MDVEQTDLEDVLVVTPKRFEDHRGYFVESFNASRFEEVVGRKTNFVQDNESKSVETGTVRALHFQRRPYDQGKLVRVVNGSVFDVAVDLRVSSPTYRQHLTVELSAENGRQLWIPAGLAHGFCTLEPDTVIAYKVTNFYNGSADQSLHWRDGDIGVQWPGCANPDSLSEKDKEALTLAELEASGPLFGQTE